MSRHELKTWPDPFAAVRRGDKPFEMRWDDREYAKGDVLVLREFDPIAGDYTGEVEERVVSYVSGALEEKFGVAHGFVALGLAEPRVQVRQAAPASPAELVGWHAEMAANARQRADNWRRAGMLRPKTVSRYEACAAAGDAEAAQHEAAVALIQQLMAAARALLKTHGEG